VKRLRLVSVSILQLVDWPLRASVSSLVNACEDAQHFFLDEIRME
jgi:hypothetical protein